MKFELRTAREHYYKESKEDMRIYNTIKDLGFEFEECEDIILCKDKKPIELEVNSLEVLIEFVSKVGDIVLDAKSILIYNDYIE